LDEITQMVTANFFVIVFISLLCFSLGRVYGRAESSLVYSNRMNEVLTAMKRVNEVASLKGEDLTKLTTEEIVQRTRKQMELNNDDD